MPRGPFNFFDDIDYHNRSQQQGSRGSAGYNWANYSPTKGHQLFLAETGKSYAYGTQATRGNQGQVKFRKNEYIDWAKNRDSKPGDPSEVAYTARTGKLSHNEPGGRTNSANRKKMVATSDFTKWEPGYIQEIELAQEGRDKYQGNLPGQGLNDVDSGGFTEQELIDAALDPTKTIVRDENGNVISIDNAVDPGTVTSTGGDALDDIGDSLENIFDGPSNDGPPPGAPTLGGTLGEVTNGTGTDTTVEEPVTIIDENINNDSNIDFTGNGESGTGGAGGTLNEVASPGFEIIGNVIYDADGNIIGTTGETAPGIAPVVGGASPTNPVFDEITAEQQAEMDRNAEAVALLDSGAGRYDAAVRKMGIIGRQGEEYAPLILDQLRMAEQEAAQPQFAAFGFGQNNMLGGMPQIGVQGVQGNVGGQSALSALSNAGLNQLNVGRQNYNRIALPDVGADGMPISQINNPTIFKASTNV